MNTVLRPLNRIQSSIKYKWIILLLIITLTPLIILGMASYAISKNAIDKKVAESSEQLIRQTAENIDIRLASYKDMLMQIISNPDIIQLLKVANHSAEDQRLVEHLSLTTKLAYFTSVSPEFKSVSFISEDHYIKGIFRWTDAIANPANEMYWTTMEAGNQFVWFPTRLGNYSDSADQHQELVFSLSKQIYDLHDNSSLGIVAVLDIRERVLSDILSKNTTDGLVVGESFIIDAQGTILAHRSRDMLHTSIYSWFDEKDSANLMDGELAATSFDARYRGRDVLVNTLKLQTNDWKVVHVIDRASRYHDSNQVINVIVIIMLLCVLFSIITAFLMARSVANPLKDMVKAMRQVNRGQLSTRISIDKKKEDEIGILQQQFNDMIARIEELIDTVYAVENNKRIAEVKALEAQINPHFLYNTLDAIKWTALFQKANNAAEMARLLSRLLHISLGKGKDTVKVHEEIEHVECYIGIQKLQLNTQFQVNITVDPAVKDCLVPKMILQPIVENSILHGFAGKDEGVITITCMQEQNKLIFQITDNGWGMEHGEEAVETSDIKNHKAFTGIGLANVEERIKLICGEQYGLHVTSKREIGTTVLISLPIMTEGVDTYVQRTDRR